MCTVTEYMVALYALEDALNGSPEVTHIDIRREEKPNRQKWLCVRARVAHTGGDLTAYCNMADTLCDLAVRVQQFHGASYVFEAADGGVASCRTYVKAV